MLETFWLESKVDYKDIKRKYIEEQIYRSMFASVCLTLSKNFNDDIVSKKWEENKIQFFPEGKYDLYLTESGQALPTLNLVKRKKGGETEHLTLDYSSIPGKFIIKTDGSTFPPMTAKELKQLLKSERLSQLES